MSDRAAACERIRFHLDRGAPWDASDVFREAAAALPDDAELLYWGALAYARSGAINEARELLDRAETSAVGEQRRRADILSLRGRLWKDELHRAPDRVDRSRIAARARDAYLAAFAIARDPYPGINAATTSLIAGDGEGARALARDVLDALGEPGRIANAWDEGTAAEAELLLGRFERAQQRYARAHADASRDAGRTATMRRQLRLIGRVMPTEVESLIAMLRAPDVIAFSGHMIDAADRATTRFPPSLEPRVAATIRERLARCHAPIVYSSAACGADLIFVECALDAGADVTLVLPFDRREFVQTSVAIGGPGWVDRFDRAVARASRVLFATDEAYLGDDVLFSHAMQLIEGLAVLRAAQLETSPRLLAVLDPLADGRIGGTHEAVLRWRRAVGEPELIDLRALRGGDRTSAACERASLDDANRVEPSHPQRTLKALLFADFAGYSQLHDADAPRFQQRFWDIAARQIDAATVKPLLANTWGDALYVVFDETAEAAAFALRLRSEMRDVDWSTAGLPARSRIRISLHAGPVFKGFDPILGRDNYFGSSVTRAARIEPVTPPGSVYASEPFAAVLAPQQRDRFSLEYVGTLALAKHYGESRLYRLEAR